MPAISTVIQRISRQWHKRSVKVHGATRARVTRGSAELGSMDALTPCLTNQGHRAAVNLCRQSLSRSPIRRAATAERGEGLVRQLLHYNLASRLHVLLAFDLRLGIMGPKSHRLTHRKPAKVLGFAKFSLRQPRQGGTR